MLAWCGGHCLQSHHFVHWIILIIFSSQHLLVGGTLHSTVCLSVWAAFIWGTHGTRMVEVWCIGQHAAGKPCTHAVITLTHIIYLSTAAHNVPFMETMFPEDGSLRGIVLSTTQRKWFRYGLGSYYYDLAKFSRFYWSRVSMEASPRDLEDLKDLLVVLCIAGSYPPSGASRHPCLARLGLSLKIGQVVVMKTNLCIFWYSGGKALLPLLYIYSLGTELVSFLKTKIHIAVLIFLSLQMTCINN